MYGGYGPQEPGNEWHERFINVVDRAVRRGARFVITTGDDALYRERLPAAGLRLVEGYGLKGSGANAGGTATAKNLLWTTGKETA